MTLKVLNPGLFTTVQDFGRTGYQSQGFSPAGAVDFISHAAANCLIGNDAGAATLEMTYKGASFEVRQDTVIGTAGSDIEMTVNGRHYTSGKAVMLLKGDEVVFGSTSGGTRTYLSVPGGFDVPEVLGSRSTHTRSGIGGFNGRTLNTGDILKARLDWVSLPPKQARPLKVSHTLRVIPGQQFDSFISNSRETFFNNSYEVTTDSDRMGMRLKGPALKAENGHDVLSEPTQLGSIQVPKNGQPIILLNDRQTAGGYKRIATIALCDIPKAAQIAPGESVSFQEIDVDSALELYRDMMKGIEQDAYTEPLNDFSNERRVPAEKIKKLMEE